MQNQGAKAKPYSKQYGELAATQILRKLAISLRVADIFAPTVVAPQIYSALAINLLVAPGLTQKSLATQLHRYSGNDA